MYSHYVHVDVPCSICWSLGALRLRCGISWMTHCSELYVLLLLVEESPKLLILFTDVTLRREEEREERKIGWKDISL